MKHRTAVFFQHLFSNTSLRLKLFFVYFILLLLPLGLFTFYGFQRIHYLTREQTLGSAQKTFDETCRAVEDSFSNLDDVLTILSMDSLVYQVSSVEQASYMSRLTDSEKLLTTFEHLRTLSGVDRIRLYVQNDYLYSNQNRNILDVKDAADSLWFQQLSTRSSYCWYAPEDFSDQSPEEQIWFSAAQLLHDPEELTRPLSILRVDLKASQILEAISNTNITEDGRFLLLRGNQVLLSSREEDKAASFPELETLLSDTSGEKWQTVSINDALFYAQCRTLSHNDWVVAALLPYSDVYALSRELRSEMFLVVLLIGILAYGIACMASSSTLKRISLLNQTMHAVEKGDVNVRLTSVGNDEIGQLMGSFSHMMERIDTLMEEKVEYGRQIKNLELKALQAQINPHFLYNTLDLIGCTAILHQVPEIARTVNTLARFYKISLSKGREVISVKEELHHARLYVQLQNMRFENRIQVTWDIQPEIEAFEIIKIVLQPLIENAIIHGIFEKPDKTGEILVKGRLDPDGIRILIADDGIGMNQEVLAANFTPSPAGQLPHTQGGYGVRNINDRLHLAYGEPYGLSCISTPGEGTEVTVFIPAIKQSD